METDIRDYSAFVQRQTSAAGVPLKPVSDDKVLREKALMYAVQSMPYAAEGVSIVDLAGFYLAFLRGDAK